VAWMVQLAAGDLAPLHTLQVQPQGAAIQVRLYAEDPHKNFQPSAGLLTAVRFPDTVRVDSWVVDGTDVPPNYDPMLAKLIAHAPSREAARAQLMAALDATVLAGIETNRAYLTQVLAAPDFVAGRATTRMLNHFVYRPQTIDVLVPGVQSSVQDWPGRVGYWDVGVPPSGPMDGLAMRLANRLVGNAEGDAALELTATGPTLRFNCASVIALAGADMGATLDGQPVARYQALAVPAGSTLALGAVQGPGLRSYLAVRGGVQVPEYLGSKSSFTLGQFGGHGGRTLRAGDVLSILPAEIPPAEGAAAAPAPLPVLPPAQQPALHTDWQIGVLYGPHGAPDFFTEGDMEVFFSTAWEIHYNSSRTGVRLIGPKPAWARTDGGEAGLHPSNIHDNPYAIGAIDFTGDMPVVLGPDGPSLGGFVCPATIVQAELWKLGQVKPGDTVRFVRLTVAQATQRQARQDAAIQSLLAPAAEALPAVSAPLSSPVLLTVPVDGDKPQVVFRQSGDANLLIEVGPAVLDLELRLRIQALLNLLKTEIAHGRLLGVRDLTPGIRSLQVHFDPRVVSQDALIRHIAALEEALPAVDDMEVPSRTVYLPLSWDDPATRLAIEKYMQSVRPDAPWCPSNIEFIQRINGLASVQEVFDVVFAARYLVLGLGDVYLGAPVATPLDPRHRLVTTKYNPARTWTPENAVGIGGAYMCVYGMEGPGGYQFVGRTVQMWNRYRRTPDFSQPWLLRFFDQIRFYPVSEAELLELRQQFVSGQFQLRTEPGTLRLKDYRAFLQQNQASIAAFKGRQQAAFEAERGRWQAAGQDLLVPEVADAPAASHGAGRDLPSHAQWVHAPVAGSVWKVLAGEGALVQKGDTLAILESMKMEFAVAAPCHGRLHTLACREGQAVAAGQELLVLEEIL